MCHMWRVLHIMGPVRLSEWTRSLSGKRFNTRSWNWTAGLYKGEALLWSLLKRQKGLSPVLISPPSYLEPEAGVLTGRQQQSELSTLKLLKWGEERAGNTSESEEKNLPRCWGGSAKLSALFLHLWSPLLDSNVKIFDVWRYCFFFLFYIIDFFLLKTQISKQRSSDGHSVHNLCFDTSAFMKVEFWYGLFNRQVESCQATLIFFFFFLAWVELRCS